MLSVQFPCSIDVPAPSKFQLLHVAFPVHAAKQAAASGVGKEGTLACRKHSGP